MNIVRNKFTTKFIGGDHIVKLSTEKFDDIMGIVDNNLPDFEEISEGNLDSIKFNEKYISIRDLMEYSDMEEKLFKKVMTKASVSIETMKTLKNFTYYYIIDLLLKICYDERHRIEDFSLIRYSAISGEYSKEDKYYTIDLYHFLHIITTFIIGSPSGKRSIRFPALYLKNEDTVKSHIEYIVRWYNDLIPDKSVFINEKGIELSLLKINEKEVEQILQNLYREKNINTSSVSNKNIDEFWDLNFVDLIMRTESWRKCISGMITLMNDRGQKELVPISDLMLINISKKLEENRMECLKIIPSKERISI